MSYVLPLHHVDHHRVVGELLRHLGWVPLAVTEELSISSCITLCLCFALAALLAVLVTFSAEQGVSQGWSLTNKLPEILSLDPCYLTDVGGCWLVWCFCWCWSGWQIRMCWWL